MKGIHSHNETVYQINNEGDASLSLRDKFIIHKDENIQELKSQSILWEINHCFDKNACFDILLYKISHIDFPMMITSSCDIQDCSKFLHISDFILNKCNKTNHDKRTNLNVATVSATLLIDNIKYFQVDFNIKERYLTHYMCGYCIKILQDTKLFDLFHFHEEENNKMSDDDDSNDNVVEDSVVSDNIFMPNIIECHRYI
jgi:hypothetical protein